MNDVALPTSRILNGLSLCSGIGGSELGLHIALGQYYRTVCYVEREAVAAALTVKHMAEGALDVAPIWDDLTTFDGRPWCGVVDIVTAGYPCQPFSTAGKRLGSDDPRHLWPHVARIIWECQPEWVFLENVANHLSLGFDLVIRGLSSLGYQVEAGLFSAEEVGATHRRERLFALAHTGGKHIERRRDGGELGSKESQESGKGLQRQRNGDTVDHSQFAVGNSNSGRHRGGSPDPERQSERGTVTPRPGVPVGHPDQPGLQRRQQPVPISPYQRPAWPPGPKDAYAWEPIIRSQPYLAPATTATSTTTETPSQSSIRGVANGLSPWLDNILPTRTDRLRALGNAQVPVCAALAFISLWTAHHAGHPVEVA